MSSADTPTDDVECPTCGRDDFASERGVKIHHQTAHGESIAGEVLICDQCGDEYRVPECESDESRFCSRACSDEARSERLSGEGHPQWEGGKEVVECHTCGECFKVDRHRADSAKYCSQECYGLAERSVDVDDTTVVCEVCGDLFQVRPARVESARFCSYDCKGKWRSENVAGENHPSWKGGYEPYYGPNWERQRRRARHRDQHRCQGCGMTEAEHIEEYGRKPPVHHLTPIRTFWEDGDLDHEAANRLDNLITLCDGCHQEWEHSPPRPQA